MLEVVVAGDHPTIIVDRETKNSGAATVRQPAEGAAANKAAGQHMQQDSAIRRRPVAERAIRRASRIMGFGVHLAKQRLSSGFLIGVGRLFHSWSTPCSCFGSELDPVAAR